MLRHPAEVRAAGIARELRQVPAGWWPAGRTLVVRAEELPADEAAAWWQRVVRRDPSYERYARATSRTIPIVRLVPVPEAG